AGIFTNVTPLKTSHFLYNVIKNNKTREKIRYEAWQEINKQFEGDKEVELGDSGKVRRIERPIFGDPAFDTEGFEETDTDHHIRNE
ncbi:MAG: hypothetical protein OEQ53_06495, partial [Saprospiraceae bacterium]|nr:hypothetical protein [Saprospiraceae bacterium]